MDKHEKTVLIPVRIVDGKIVELDGNALPEISDTVGELRVPSRQIVDDDVRQGLLEEKKVKLLDGGEVVLMGVSRRMLPDNHSKEGLKDRPKGLIVGAEWDFVEVRLGQPLMLQIRGTKKAQLLPCRCTIAGLPNDDANAKSLNEAFTRISIHFERKRRSHTGNIFDRAFAFVEGRWRSFSDLRRQADGG